ncbi:MAG TPA: class I SAM-dependent methyltransferase [Solirubrobacterales bacterium]|nr:class I SAM-dependent methyltransferase [Solirubrobacterales bacterium]
MSEQSTPPSRRIRAVGRAVSNVAARAPWLWPLLRGPVRRYFSELAVGWDDRTGAGGVEHLEPLAAAVLHVSPAPERVLDVGCGTGAGTLFLAREFPQARVRGVDLSEEMVHAAVAKVGLDPEGRVAFKVGDASSLPYAEDSFDLVAQLNMPPFFAELARVLRPGGQVIVASSWGPETPFYTRPSLLRWKFLQHGIEPVEVGDAGRGTFYVGRLPKRD